MKQQLLIAIAMAGTFTTMFTAMHLGSTASGPNGFAVLSFIVAFILGCALFAVICMKEEG